MVLLQRAMSEGPCVCWAAGSGVIVHSSEGVGLVVVDRSTVPVNGGNITLSFGAYPDELPARVRFLHPLHNFAIVSYDPCSLSHQVGPTSQSVQSCISGSTPKSQSPCMKILHTVYPGVLVPG